MTKKHILFLGDAASAHMERWAFGMRSQGFEVSIFSLRPAASLALYKNAGIRIFNPELNLQQNRFWSSLLSKMVYIKALPALKRTIKELNPDIVHAHYASSYGLLGALCGFHPFCISVWGSDVLSFPLINILTKKILQFNFRKADRILVTSKELFQATSLYTKKVPEIIAFGIEPDMYQLTSNKNENAVVFGSAKALAPVYGHDTALNAFAKARPSLPQGSRFIIAGAGREENALKNLAIQLGISDVVEFKGQLPKEDIPAFLGSLDILVNMSRSESFGVVVIEAAACEVPAIVSDTGGLREVVVQNETGIRVPTDSIQGVADAMLLLSNNIELRKAMGQAARKFVMKNYLWTTSLEKMTVVYQSVLNSRS
jgi:L-malate glycosyltransferase